MSENNAETPKKSINAFTAFEHYDDFKGEATPAEFWSFFLLIHVVIFLLMIPGLPVFFREVSDSTVNNNWHAPLALALPIIIWGIIVLIPLFSVLVRRLNNAAWGSYFIGLLAVLPALCCLYLWLRPEADFKWLIFWIYEILFVLAGCLPEKKTAEVETADAADAENAACAQN